jgi:hypothetical protein
MSFLDSVVSFGKTALGFVGGDTLGGSLARTALLGFATKKLNDMVVKENEAGQAAKRDMGTREQVDPDTEHAIPVVYGEAYLSGMVTDAVLTSDNKTMWYCITLSEKTGSLMNGTPSVISFKELYWNGNRVEFGADGVTVSGMVSEDKVVANNYNGKVRVYPFNNGSTGATKFVGLGTGNSSPAYSIFPNWTSAHTMDELVFCLVRVDYDGAAGVTGLGDLKFRLSNTMKQPGDVLYDYMTNTRYGAGIPAQEMNT